MGRISFKDVLHQLKEDLIGKDSYRGVTLTYSWLANQFGHIALGFIPTFILFSSAEEKWGEASAAFWSPIIISAIWLAFETYNFLGPLLSKKQSKSNLLFFPGEKEYVFPPAWANIAFDTFTDLLFFWFGAFWASLHCFFLPKVLVIFLVIVALKLFPACYWYLTKMYIQQAQYPSQFRLSQWDFDIKEEDKHTVLDFLTTKEKAHLLLFGTKLSGKTSLAVGIGTEISIKHNPCCYSTAMKLYSMFFEADEKILTDKKFLWTWRKSDILVIDDINPGDPIPENIVDAKRFLQFIDKLGDKNQENRNALKTKKVIWVLGNEKPKSDFVEQWKAMLLDIKVDKKNIYSIDLNPSRTPDSLSQREK